MFDVATRPRAKHLIWDMVLPLAEVVQNDFGVLDRFWRAGHSCISLTIAGDDCGLAEAMHRLAAARRQIAAWPEALVLLESAKDVEHARKHNLLAVGLHLEGTECLERDPEMIDAMYALGIRHTILAFNQNNSAAGGCGDLGNVGLTRLGHRYLDRMREVGMMLDASHMGERSSLEAIEYIDRPAVFTHSNARGIFDHYRNLSDEQVRACAKSGGMVGISGSSGYTGPADTLVEGVFRHLNYFVQLVGPDHVGFGTDYIVDTKALFAHLSARPEEWPTGEQVSYNNMTFLPPESIASLIDRMQQAGYDEDSIGKIAGGNYLRIAQALWR